MILFGHVALVACVLLGVILFRFHPGHRLVIRMYVIGVLFLPEFGSTEFVEGVPPPLTAAGVQLNKTNALAIGLLTGSLLFDHKRWLVSRPRWFDIPMLVWCLDPIISSVANSLLYDDPIATRGPVQGGFLKMAASLLVSSDLYDGLTRALDVALSWGVPYCLARLYITDARKLTELVIWIVVGAAVYAPLCALEMWMSPQLHRWVYGFHQHEFLQSIRYDGYRPMVFLEHGIAVGLWMVVGSVAAIWLWFMGPLRRLTIVRTQVNGLWVVLPLCVVAVACRSTGALILFAIGLVILTLAWAVRRPAPALIFLCIAPLYATVRMAGSWDAGSVVGMTGKTVGQDRAQSLEFRLENERMLIAKALERPLVGWGGWGRSRVYDEFGQAITIADGLWIVTLGEGGLIGLITLGFLVLLPVARLILLHGSTPWTQPKFAATAVAGVIVGLYSIDCLMNGMLNPIYILLIGSLVALSPNGAEPRADESTTDATNWRIEPVRRVSRVRTLRVRSRVAALRGSQLPIQWQHGNREQSDRPPVKA